MSDLKPCPFCGSDNVMVDNIVLNDCFTAFCGDCISKSTNFSDFNDAVEAWNNRPHENKIKAEALREYGKKALDNCERLDGTRIRYHEALGALLEESNKLERDEL